MKAYIAAPWANKTAARAIRDHLVSLGHESTATWFDEGHDYRTGEEARAEAERDLAEIDAADFIIAYLPEENTSRGGMDFELGFAYQYRYPIVLIGARRNVFHYLGDLRHYDSLEAWKNGQS